LPSTGELQVSEGTGNQRIRSASEFEQLRRELRAKRDSIKTWISVCGGTSCSASEARPVREALQEAIAKKRLKKKVGLKLTGCHGFCEHGPLVVVSPDGICYERVKPEDAMEIVERTVLEHQVIERLLYVDPTTREKVPLEKDIPFYSRQTRVLLAGNMLVDAETIDDYLAIGGYQALVKVLTEMSPEEVISEVAKSGLRGRGGAGFSTATKWEACRQSPGSTKYLICNADEGDPGAYMDRSVLEGNPHSVLEGMIIGAYAIGAQHGYVYVRTEYPLAIEHLGIAIEQARGHGLLGSDILGSGFDFDVTINRGAGAFVCGEETALMASIEGRRGMPRLRPPHPTQSGLWGKPTTINNVETWASVPIIVREGGDQYARIGTETGKGTKIFSLVGKINNTGLVEVPMGITLREIIEDIGGGIPDGKRFKAVQTGGPSGGCIPEEHLDLPVDYESLTEVGSIMGSGGMIVMDETTCMVDVAHYFLSFTQEESCGKCTPCRIGTRQMVEILARIKQGDGTPEDLKRLEELAEAVKVSSLCGLGQTAPNPVLTTLRYFHDEYEAHVNEGRCPALVCPDLVYFEITDSCVGCGICVKECATGAITGERRKVHRIDQVKCMRCGTCVVVCPPKISAVEKHSPVRAVAS
jgi:NADH:ubiquinone oxidoreductase subunit F (NADH-binding)/(2Fe-2S) ferredoxin/NAD-dependent dihydropyrimidine dehydrogenase PreA subunit